jgi:hypothetical protein
MVGRRLCQIMPLAPPVGVPAVNPSQRPRRPTGTVQSTAPHHPATPYQEVDLSRHAQRVRSRGILRRRSENGALCGDGVRVCCVPSGLVSIRALLPP